MTAAALEAALRGALPPELVGQAPVLVASARDLARCDGPPDHTYHAVYTAAAELLLALDRGEGR